jgi:hypothetical protein
MVTPVSAKVKEGDNSEATSTSMDMYVAGLVIEEGPTLRAAMTGRLLVAPLIAPDDAEQAEIEDGCAPPSDVWLCHAPIV